MGYETVEEDYTVPEQIKSRERVVARICDGCGKRDEASGEFRDFSDPYWIPISIEAGEAGEEGWNELDRIFCGDCAPETLKELAALGFADHHHGSINFLEDIDCPGSGVHEPFGPCPTPSKGPYDDEDDEDY